MKNIFLVISLFLANYLQAQVSETTPYPFRRGTLEVSVTGFPQDSYEDISTGRSYNYLENSIHLSLFTNIGKYFMVGINYNYLWTRYKQHTVDNYFFTGLNVRYDRPVNNKLRIYGDAFGDIGNYCSCTKDVRFDNFPFKIDNSFYLGSGFGVAFKVYKPIWINLAINSYTLIGKKYDSYGYVQPIIGIQIHAF